MRRLILGLLFIAFASLASIPSHETLSPLWNSALAALKEQKNSEARELFSEWIRQAEDTGVESPEAYFNLALAEWSLSQTAPSITHFVRSASLVSSPIENWRNLQLLHRLEKEAGIKESATHQVSFWLKMILNSNVTTLFFVIAFWIFVLLSVWRWWRSERGLATASLAMVMVFPTILWTISAVGFANLKLGHQYAVLTDKTEVALFQSPDEKEKLIELPAGTIIESGKHENGFVQVIEPVSGWARTAQVNPLQFPEIEVPEIALFKK